MDVRFLTLPVSLPRRTPKELKLLKIKISESQNTVDTILLRAAQAEDSLGIKSKILIIQNKFGILTDRFNCIGSQYQGIMVIKFS